MVCWCWAMWGVCFKGIEGWLHTWRGPIGGSYFVRLRVLIFFFEGFLEVEANRRLSPRLTGPRAWKSSSRFWSFMCRWFFIGTPCSISCFNLILVSIHFLQVESLSFYVLFILSFHRSLTFSLNHQSWAFLSLIRWLLIIIFRSPHLSFLIFSIFPLLSLLLSHKTTHKHFGTWLALHYTLLHMNRPSAITKNLLDTKPTPL